MVDDVCFTLGVELVRGQLVLRCENVEQVTDAVHRVAQAVVRVSDIWFTFRTRSPKSITDEVDDWLKQRSFKFEKGVQREGRSGRGWMVDYQVVAGAHMSLVFVLSSGSRAAARRVSELVFAACSDLSHLVVRERDAALVSLFDDTTDVWRDEDLALAQGVSRVATWSQHDEFERILTSEWTRPSARLTAQ